MLFITSNRKTVDFMNNSSYYEIQPVRTFITLLGTFKNKRRKVCGLYTFISEVLQH